MQAKGDGDQLYSRGRYRLDWRTDASGRRLSPNLYIFWYEADTGHVRSKSTGTADETEAEFELDKLYLKKERGAAVCPTCGQIKPQGTRFLLTDAMSDYLVALIGKPAHGTARARLGHITNYLIETERMATVCEDVTEEWIEDFRDWAFEVPVVSSAGRILGDRSAGTVEGSVRSLSAAINRAFDRKDTLQGPLFKALKPDQVSETPTYRADLKALASMFNYCLRPPMPVGTSEKAMDRQIEHRAALLRFLRVSVATWCRPDAAYDVSTEEAKRQWHSTIRALNLSPRGRRQTKKYRPVVPIARQFAPHLDECVGPYVGVDNVRTAFEGMLDALKMPRDRETGQKLIRRSMAKLGRSRLGESLWIEGQLMLGHRVHSQISDVYAAFEAGYLPNVLAVTEGIIDDIEKLAPGAFHRSDTALRIAKAWSAKR